MTYFAYIDKNHLKDSKEAYREYLESGVDGTITAVWRSMDSDMQEYIFDHWYKAEHSGAGSVPTV